MKTISIKILSNLLLLAPIMLVAFPAHADTVVRTGETVSVAEDQEVTGDFYTAASVINISGTVDGDFLAVGGRSTLNGEVTEDAFMAGGSVDVHGSVGDDLRIIGGEVTIAEPVTGDVFVIGGNVSIISTASIGGDLLVYGGEVTVDAPVGGDVLGHTTSLRIDSEIAGKVDVTTNQLTLGDRAVIEGGVSYVSPNLVTRSQNAKVSGDVLRNDPVVPETEGASRTQFLVPILALLFTVLVWFLVAKDLLAKVVATAVARRPRPMLLGLGTLLLAPFAIMILIVSMLGTYIGITAFFAYVLLILVALVVVSAVAGQFAMMVFNQPTKELTLLTIGAGVVTVVLLVLIPVVGPLVLFGLFLLSIGALVEVVIWPKSS